MPGEGAASQSGVPPKMRCGDPELVATFLYRLGRTAFRRRWSVLLVWVALLLAVGAGAATAPAAEEDGSFMPGIEAQSAFDLIEQRFPGSNSEGVDARIVFVAPDGQKITAADHRVVIDELVAEVGGGAQVDRVVSPFRANAVSEDASTAYATVSYKVKADDLTDATKSTLENAIDVAQKRGMTVEVGGPALATEPAVGGMAEAVGVALAAVVLLVTFGSLAAAGLPLLTAVIGVGISMAAILALGSTFGLSLTTGTLASMLGLAVGIDYALFVVSRYREERAKGRTPQEAAGLAAGTAGSAVVFAGLTVVIALAGLTVVGVPMLTNIEAGACVAVWKILVVNPPDTSVLINGSVVLVEEQPAEVELELVDNSPPCREDPAQCMDFPMIGLSM